MMQPRRRPRSPIEGKRVVPSVPPKFKVVLGSGDEDPAPPARRNGVSGLGLFIEYVDAKAEVTRRRISCKSYDPAHDWINAWCFEREGPRHFRLDRITLAACTETGELFEVHKLLAILRKRGMPVRDKRLAKALTPIVFLMRCDGVQEGETEALEAAVTAYALRFDGNDDTVADGMRLASTLAPDEADFRRTLGWLRMRRDGPELAKFIQREGCRMLDADGRHSAEEVTYGMLLDRSLRPIIERR